MLEERSQSKLINYSAVINREEKSHLFTMKQYGIRVYTVPSSVGATSSTYWNAGELYL